LRADERAAEGGEDVVVAGGGLVVVPWRGGAPGGDVVGGLAVQGVLKFPANVDVAHQEFEGLEADALIELGVPGGQGTRRVDVFVELDRTRRPAKNSPRFRRYDHFITGWSTLLDRYADALKERPIVVFVCDDGKQALDFLKLADSQVTGAIGVKGTEIAEWQHPRLDPHVLRRRARPALRHPTRVAPAGQPAKVRAEPAEGELPPARRARDDGSVSHAKIPLASSG
jgi:hypothetical protein